MTVVIPALTGIVTEGTGQTTEHHQRENQASRYCSWPNDILKKLPQDPQSAEKRLPQESHNWNYKKLIKD